MKELKYKTWELVNDTIGFIVESGEGIEIISTPARRSCNSAKVESGEGIESCCFSNFAELKDDVRGMWNPVKELKENHH